MVGDIVAGILEFLFRAFVEIFLFYTGELILFVLSLGKKKPRWNFYANESPPKFVIFSEISVWIGIAFWLLVFWFINNRLFQR
jgi:hypothetical protein